MQFSYTISPFLKSELDEIDARRAKILLTPLPPKTEIQLRWEAIIDRISYSLRLQNLHVKKLQIAHLLSSHRKEKFSHEERLVIQYKKAYDYICQNWIGSADRVTVKTVQKLWSFTDGQALRTDFDKLEKNLEFIQINPEHPINQAALAQILILSILPLNPQSEQLSRLLSLLFFYKNGYDFRGLLVLEEYFSHNIATYRETIENNLHVANMSRFLEYFAEIIITETTSILEKLSAQNRPSLYPESYFTLTQRQKEILSLFDEPGVRVTNRSVQKLFSISQITASRDLTKIASLNLIAPAGKGRSVYYTKI